MRSLRIAMFGLGYVGTTTAACLLNDGHEVMGIDVNPEKLDAIGRGRSPIVEPGVGEFLAAGCAAGRLRAAPRLDPWLDELDLAMICVGTPSRADGKLELTHLLEVARQLGHAACQRRAQRPLLLVFRSTVPPGTMESLVLPTLADAAGQGPGEAYEVAFNPEFLRESTAVKDYYAPPKIVIGERAPGVTRRLEGIYDGLEAPLFEVRFPRRRDGQVRRQQLPRPEGDVRQRDRPDLPRASGSIRRPWRTSSSPTPSSTSRKPICAPAVLMAAPACPRIWGR